jgi:hypothetical protein
VRLHTSLTPFHELPCLMRLLLQSLYWYPCLMLHVSVQLPAFLSPMYREIEEKTRTALLGGSIDINDIYEEKDDDEFTEDVEEEPEVPKEALAA